MIVKKPVEFVLMLENRILTDEVRLFHTDVAKSGAPTPAKPAAHIQLTSPLPNIVPIQFKIFSPRIWN